MTSIVILIGGLAWCWYAMYKQSKRSTKRYETKKGLQGEKDKQKEPEVE